jgi:hypothetical protein
MVAYVRSKGMGSPLKRRKADDSYRVMTGGGSVEKSLNSRPCPTPRAFMQERAMIDVFPMSAAGKHLDRLRLASS